jgi:hypothetical protein
MKSSLHASSAPGKRFRALVCLISVLLLWSPAWAAALQANGIGCCDGAMCAARGHSPMNRGNSTATPAQTTQPMQCEHSGGGSAMHCSLSCCHEQPQSLIASIQFVLPQSPVLGLSEDFLEALRALESNQVLQSFDPLSPPPRHFFR